MEFLFDVFLLIKNFIFIIVLVGLINSFFKMNLVKQMIISLIIGGIVILSMMQFKNLLSKIPKNQINFIYIVNGIYGKEIINKETNYLYILIGTVIIICFLVFNKLILPNVKSKFQQKISRGGLS